MDQSEMAATDWLLTNWQVGSPQQVGTQVIIWSMVDLPDKDVSVYQNKLYSISIGDAMQS